jgi:hypothetical protein
VGYDWTEQEADFSEISWGEHKTASLGNIAGTNGTGGTSAEGVWDMKSESSSDQCDFECDSSAKVFLTVM